MAETGESYQKALSRLRAKSVAASVGVGEVDLLNVDVFGVRVTIATFELLQTVSCVAMPHGKSPLFALARPRVVH